MLVKINDYQWINPALIVYVNELKNGRAEVHLYGGTVVYADNLDSLNIRSEQFVDDSKPTKKK